MGVGVGVGVGVRRLGLGAAGGGVAEMPKKMGAEGLATTILLWQTRGVM